MGFPGTAETGGGSSFQELFAGIAGQLFTVDWTEAQRQSITLSGDCIFSFVPPPAAGADLTLRLIRGATVPAFLYFPSNCRWPNGSQPAFDFSDSNNQQLIRIYFDGSDYHCRLAGPSRRLPVQMNIVGYGDGYQTYGTPGFGITIGGGPNRIAFVVLGVPFSFLYGSIGSVTMGGQPMTRLIPPSDDYQGLEIFYRLNPPAGFQFFNFSGFTNTAYLYEAFALTGVDQTNPIAADSSSYNFNDYTNPFYIQTNPLPSSPNQFFLNICASQNGAYGGPYNPVDAFSTKLFENALPSPQHNYRHIAAIVGPIDPPGYRQTFWQGSSGFGSRIERRILLNPA